MHQRLCNVDNRHFGNTYILTPKLDFVVSDADVPVS